MQEVLVSVPAIDVNQLHLPQSILARLLLDHLNRIPSVPSFEHIPFEQDVSEVKRESDPKWDGRIWTIGRSGSERHHRREPSSLRFSRVGVERLHHVLERPVLVDGIHQMNRLAVDEEGEYLPLTIDGKECRGPEQFEALNRVIKRAFRAGTRATEEDKDRFYYLWAGPRSPLFGKDRMATFETYFVANKDARKEIKNPWFKKIHDFDFCDRLCREMGIESGGLVVNGHVPVRVEQGEVPLKDGGNAVTIDGAFSEAYGDRGYTLILAPEGEVLAEHHAFPDPVSAVRDGRDLVPTRTLLRSYDTPRVIGDTEKGVTLKAKIQALEELVDAYENGDIPERPSRMV